MLSFRKKKKEIYEEEEVSVDTLDKLIQRKKTEQPPQDESIVERIKQYFTNIFSKRQEH